MITRFVASLFFRLLFVLIFFLIGFVIEALVPAIEDPKSGITLNCLHAIWYQICDTLIGATVAFYCIEIAHKLPIHGLVRIAGTGFAKGVGLSLAAIAFSDFFNYWLHRLQHANRWLWAEHELHHSDEHVNVTTAWRHHWLDTILIPAFGLFPAAIIFDPPLGSFLALLLVMKGMNYFVHLNSRISFGAFNRLFTTPQIHRIHHSRQPEHIDKNFATIFPVWDIVFGTYYHPKAQEWPRTGVEGVRVNSLRQAIVMPFSTWRKMLAEPWSSGGVKKLDAVSHSGGNHS